MGVVIANVTQPIALFSRLLLPRHGVHVGVVGGVTAGIPRLGVPPYQYHSEGLHGLRSTCGLGRDGDTLYSTTFPQVTAMAATGNLTLVLPSHVVCLSLCVMTVNFCMWIHVSAFG